MSDDHFNLKRQFEAARKLNEERSQLYAKRKLTDNISKKLKTTMIGALASFEETFGHLWGQGKKPHELTQSEEQYRQLWDNVRTEILNKGNNQLRAASEELSIYSVKLENYKENFIIKRGNNGQ